jgi:hypothetical protein
MEKMYSRKAELSSSVLTLCFIRCKNMFILKTETTVALGYFKCLNELFISM